MLLDDVGMFVVGCGAGFVLGWTSCWLSRKFYWYFFAPRFVRRHFSTLRYRRRVCLALRHRRHFPTRALRSYAGYNSDYRLSKLFDKLEPRADD